MKAKTLLYLLTIALLSLESLAQSSLYQINYQGVARDASGTVFQNKNMRIRLTVYDLNPKGPILYSETRMVTTNKFGLFTVAIGNPSGTISVTGKLDEVNWGKDLKYLGVEIDPKGGNNYISLGTSQLLSVPYSIYSLSSKDGLPSSAGQKGKFLTTDGAKAFWEFIEIPKYSFGTGLNINNQHITVKDTAIFNASKILDGIIDITDRKNNNVLAWDSISNKYKYVPVEILSGINLKYVQNGNSFGQPAIFGTNDSFELKFKTNNNIVAKLDIKGMFSTNYFDVKKQFLAPPTFFPGDPIILPNGELGYNGEFIPPYSFMQDPKTGISMEYGDAPSICFINRGRTLLRTYWEAGKVGDAAVIAGLGENRLSIQSESNMVHIAKTSRFEWEGTQGKYLDFVGYSASSFQGKTFRFTTEQAHPATPLAVMPLGNAHALDIIDSVDDILSTINNKGWLGINVANASAPLHVSTFNNASDAPIIVFENNTNQEIFTSYNNRKSYFSEKVYYRTNPIFNTEDDLALVNKKYVDDLLSLNGLNATNTQATLVNNSILIDPSYTQETVILNFPENPRNGEEMAFYFGGSIESGIVAKKLELAKGKEGSVFQNSLPSNIHAGQVIVFKWFAKSGKWFIK